MTVKVREYKRGGFEVDIRFTYPDGTAFRRRLKAKGITSTSAAKRWGEERERQFLIAPLPTELAKQEQALVPVLSEFGPSGNKGCLAGAVRRGQRSVEQVVGDFL